MTEVTEKRTDLPWGEITDETIAYAAELLGKQLRRDRMAGWVTEVNIDAIRHFAEGLGDRNPLWRDPEYGKHTRWGATLAPPTILYSVDGTTVAPRLAGVQWLYAGTDWVWYDVIKRGDAFDAPAVFYKQDVKGGEFASRWLLQTGHIKYIRREDGALVGEAFGKCARTPRGNALKKEGKQKYKAREEYQYTADEIFEIEKAQIEEGPRGADTLFAEDVNVGDELRPIVKGPLTSTDMVAWYAGWSGAGPYGGAHGDAVRYRTRHQDFHISEKTGARESAGRGHLERKTGEDVGMGGAYDIGPQRISWGVQMLTDWMGDDGFLHTLSATVSRPNLLGDTTTWHGTVSAKDVVDGYHLITIDMYADNQRGEKNSKATATVLLPSKNDGPVATPIPRNLTESK